MDPIVDNIVGLLFLIAATTCVIGLGWGIIAAFKRSFAWGFVSLLFAPAGVVAFLILTWRENYKPLVVTIVGFLLGIWWAILLGFLYGGF